MIARAQSGGVGGGLARVTESSLTLGALASAISRGEREKKDNQPKAKGQREDAYHPPSQGTGNEGAPCFSPAALTVVTPGG